MPQIPLTTRNAEDRPLVIFDYTSFDRPAVAQPITFVVPRGYRFQIMSLYASIVTDANVADRVLYIQISGPNGPFFRFQPPFLIAASETRYVTAAPGIAQVAHSATNMSAVLPIPSGIVLEEGTIFTLGLVNAQAGDQLSAGVVQLLSQFVAE